MDQKVIVETDERRTSEGCFPKGQLGDNPRILLCFLINQKIHRKKRGKEISYDYIF